MNPRSYKIKTEDGGEYIRNRRHLMKVSEEYRSEIPELEAKEISRGNEEMGTEIMEGDKDRKESVPEPRVELRRSRRTIKPVVKLDL